MIATLRRLCAAVTIRAVTARALRANITTLVYAVHDGRVLLLLRRKQPNLGLWSPPGGKLEPGETPLDCAVRELHEETGLDATTAELVAVVSEMDAIRRDTWLTFVVRVGVSSDTPLVGSSEGDPSWVPFGDVASLPAPPADALILAAVLDRTSGVAFLNVRLTDGVLESVTRTQG
jgi:8-oxo-dGTP diphosphatase